MVVSSPQDGKTLAEQHEEDRREFLRRCGRFALVTPPAMTALLTVEDMPSAAYASTIGRPTAGHSGKTPRGNAWGLYD